MFQSHLKALENWGACAEAVYVTANLGGCILPSSHVFEYQCLALAVMLIR
jgi:hypothetical protein